MHKLDKNICMYIIVYMYVLIYVFHTFSELLTEFRIISLKLI